jgi:phosphoribosylformylglycinamidine synthase PurS subunit
VTRRYRVTITRKAGLSDPEGATTLKALVDLGFEEVDRVSFGRVITLDLTVDDDATGRAQVDAMCAKLLANPVMEEYTVEAVS